MGFSVLPPKKPSLTSNAGSAAIAAFAARKRAEAAAKQKEKEAATARKFKLIDAETKLKNEQEKDAAARMRNLVSNMGQKANALKAAGMPANAALLIQNFDTQVLNKLGREAAEKIRNSPHYQATVLLNLPDPKHTKATADATAAQEGAKQAVLKTERDVADQDDAIERKTLLTQKGRLEADTAALENRMLHATGPELKRLELVKANLGVKIAENNLSLGELELTGKKVDTAEKVANIDQRARKLKDEAKLLQLEVNKAEFDKAMQDARGNKRDELEVALLESQLNKSNAMVKKLNKGIKESGVGNTLKFIKKGVATEVLLLSGKNTIDEIEASDMPKLLAQARENIRAFEVSDVFKKSFQRGLAGQKAKDKVLAPQTVRMASKLTALVDKVFTANSYGSLLKVATIGRFEKATQLTEFGQNAAEYVRLRNFSVLSIRELAKEGARMSDVDAERIEGLLPSLFKNFLPDTPAVAKRLMAMVNELIVSRFSDMSEVEFQKRLDTLETEGKRLRIEATKQAFGHNETTQKKIQAWQAERAEIKARQTKVFDKQRRAFNVSRGRAPDDDGGRN